MLDGFDEQAKAGHGPLFVGGCGQGQNDANGRFARSCRTLSCLGCIFTDLCKRFMSLDHIRQINPLERVAGDFASEVTVLCFDEFFVSDIGDAMILGELFKELFKKGGSCCNVQCRTGESL